MSTSTGISAISNPIMDTTILLRLRDEMACMMKRGATTKENSEAITDIPAQTGIRKPAPGDDGILQCRRRGR